MLKKLFLVVIFLGGLAATVAAREEAAPSNSGTVSSVSGDVKIMKKGETAWSDARTGMAFNEGDRVKTGEGAEAEISLENGSVMSVEENSETGLDSFVCDEENDNYETQLNVMMGKVLADVGKISNEKLNFEIRTPVAVTAVRGTQFMVDAADGNSTEVATFEGRVAVKKLGEKEEVIVTKHREITLRKDVKISKKTLKIKPKHLALKKKFIHLRQKAEIKRKEIKIRRKHIQLMKKPEIKTGKKIQLEKKKIKLR